MFDESFLNTTITDSTATEYAPCPEGEYNAVIDKLETRSPKGNAILEVYWRLDAPGVEDADGRSIRQGFFLDLSPEGTLLTGKGKNVQLGRLRDALKQNVDGQPWTPTMMIGQVARVTVKNRAGDEGQIYSDVRGVAPV